MAKCFIQVEIKALCKSKLGPFLQKWKACNELTHFYKNKKQHSKGEDDVWCIEHALGKTCYYISIPA